MSHEHTPEQHDRLDFLARQQEKDLLNLERVFPEKLVRMAEKLGVIESPEMSEIREAFLRLLPPENEVVDYANDYITLGQQLVDKIPTQKGRLGLSILLVAFYSTQHTDEVMEYYFDAYRHAFVVAEQLREDEIYQQLDRLNQDS